MKNNNVIFDYNGQLIRGKARTISMQMDASSLTAPLLTCDLNVVIDTISDSTGDIPTRILQSGNRTIVFWEDGTKTIVKRAEDEENNAYAAFTAALAIKAYGSNSKVKSIIYKKLEVQERDTDSGKMEIVENYKTRKHYHKLLKKLLKGETNE